MVGQKYKLLKHAYGTLLDVSVNGKTVKGEITGYYLPKNATFHIVEMPGYFPPEGSAVIYDHQAKYSEVYLDGMEYEPCD